MHCGKLAHAKNHCSSATFKNYLIRRHTTALNRQEKGNTMTQAIIGNISDIDRSNVDELEYQLNIFEYTITEVDDVLGVPIERVLRDLNNVLRAFVAVIKEGRNI